MKLVYNKNTKTFSGFSKRISANNLVDELGTLSEPGGKVAKNIFSKFTIYQVTDGCYHLTGNGFATIEINYDSQIVQVTAYKKNSDEGICKLLRDEYDAESVANFIKDHIK